jgi:hypothetical protein
MRARGGCTAKQQIRHLMNANVLTPRQNLKHGTTVINKGCSIVCSAIFQPNQCSLGPGSQIVKKRCGALTLMLI